MDAHNAAAARPHIQPALEPPSLAMAMKAASAFNARFLEAAARVERVHDHLTGAPLKQSTTSSISDETPAQPGAIEQLLDLIEVGRVAVTRIEIALNGIDRALGA